MDLNQIQNMKPENCPLDFEFQWWTVIPDDALKWTVRILP
jgi:hypothetical protein